METVKAFNAELSSLYEMKPPISKAKMTAITKGAIKAVKFYKHVVQSVEKFLQKCRPEYKIPGLYVIDSIVRQSRHQFGADKDVFAPRFSKNINFTFYFIYQCTAEEKSKVIRVLNLWQKNTVFPAEAIQPLFDMADTNHPKFKEVAMAIGSKGASSSGLSLSKSLSTMNSQDSSGNLNGNQESSVGGYEDASNDGNQSQSLIMGNLPSLSSTEMSLAARLQHLQHLFGQEPANSAAPVVPQPAKPPQANDTGQIRFNKKLLDFDYDDEDDEPNLGSERVKEQQSNQGQPLQQPQVSGDSLGNILNNPDIIRQLQSLQQQISRPAIGVAPVMNVGLAAHKPANNHSMDVKEQSQEDASFPSVDLSQPPPGFTTMNMNMGLPLSMQLPMGMAAHGLPVSGLGHQVVGFPHPPLPQQQHPGQERREDVFQPPPNNNGDTHENEPLRIKERDRRRSRSRSGSRNRNNQRSRHRKSRSRSRSRDRDRDSRRRRPGSRSRSRSRSLGRNRRRRSRSKDREEREKERAEREKERERKRKGLPAVKKDFLSVCSTTLWVGHLSKLVQQEELSDTFGQYGEIVSIDLIPPRGCAFVCMHRRQDAYRALTKLAGHKLQGKAITLAWAPGKGVKAKEWKDYWEVDQGVSYIPWAKLSNMTDWEALEEGGSFDEETLPPWVRNNAMDNQTDIPQMMIPPGFIPIPESGLVGQGPPTPETGMDLNIPVPPMPPGSTSGGAASLTTTLPPNLPTYAMAPLGLMPGSGLVPALPLGMPPGIRLPPHGLMVGPPHGNNMSSLLGQSILAGLRPSLPNSNVSAASPIGMPPRMNLGHQGAGPPGFFNVFPPSAVPNHQQAVQQHNEDDMELEEAEDEIIKDHPQQRLVDMRDRMNWEENDKEKQRDVHHQPDLRPRDPPKPSGQPSLQDRLRSLANNEIPPGHPANPSNRPHFGSMEMGHNGNIGNDQDRMRVETGPLIVRSDLGIGRNVGIPMGGIVPNGGNGPMYALSPNLASSLRGAPLTSAGAPSEMGIRLLRPPNDSFGTPSRLPDEPFTSRHLLGGNAHGGIPFNNSADNFTPTRGGVNNSPRVPIGNRGIPYDGRGGGFRGALEPTEPEHRSWEEEMRWRDDERYREVNPDWNHGDRERPADYGDRDRPWRDRDNDRMDSRRGGRDWGGPNRRPPPAPRNDRDRGGGGIGSGGNRDRFGRDRDRSDRNDRRERSGERDRERDRGERDKDRDHDRRSSDRRGSTRWSSVGGSNSRKSPEPEKSAPAPPPPPPPPETITHNAESVPNVVNAPEGASLPAAPPPRSPPPPPGPNDIKDVPMPPQALEPQSGMNEAEAPIVAEAPAVQPSVAEPPVAEPLVVEAPVVRPPVEDAPMVQPPMVGPQVEKEPMVQAPFEEETPVVKAPIVVEAEVQAAEETAPPSAVAVD